MASKGKEKVSVDDARQLVARREAVAVDVRSEEEWIAGHVPGAIHLPDADAEAGAKQPEEGARLMVIADDGKSAAKAAEKLSDQGYDAVAVDGGMDDWTSENFNVQPTEDPDEDTHLGGELSPSPVKDEDSQ
jgi:thiosulfate sulfurtransferase